MHPFRSHQEQYITICSCMPTHEPGELLVDPKSPRNMRLISILEIKPLGNKKN
jgi:hypothetical protein